MMRCSARENRALYPLDVRKTMREEMDEFENYCLAYGVKERGGLQRIWMYRRYRSLDDTNGMITDSEREMEENK